MIGGGALRPIRGTSPLPQVNTARKNSGVSVGAGLSLEEAGEASRINPLLQLGFRVGAGAYPHLSPCAKGEQPWPDRPWHVATNVGASLLAMRRAGGARFAPHYKTQDLHPQALWVLESLWWPLVRCGS